MQAAAPGMGWGLGAGGCVGHTGRRGLVGPLPMHCTARAGARWAGLSGAPPAPTTATWPAVCRALLAETLHSIADIMNQVLLRMGVVKSRRAPTSDYPYGFHRWAAQAGAAVHCMVRF